MYRMIIINRKLYALLTINNTITPEHRSESFYRMQNDLSRCFISSQEIISYRGRKQD